MESARFEIMKLIPTPLALMIESLGCNMNLVNQGVVYLAEILIGAVQFGFR